MSNSVESWISERTSIHRVGARVLHPSGWSILAHFGEALADSLHRGEAPFASHLLYTQPGVLDDTIPAERELGINAGFAWHPVVDAVIVYDDLGISGGMRQGISTAESLGLPIEVRRIR